MKTYTARGLIRHMLLHEGAPSAALRSWRAEVARDEAPRMETLLDAARGLFAMRSEIPAAGSWAIRLCGYACNPRHGFSPAWRAWQLKAECEFALGDIASAKASHAQLERHGEQFYEARIVADRLYQKFCQNERFFG